MSLPRICADLSPTGGHIKREPADFVVREVPLYEPSGTGEHVYLRHRRAGHTTPELVERLARAFDVRRFDVGVAGLKDRVSVAEQTFSVPVPRADVDEVARRAAAALPGEVLWARRHANKLRRGHLVGNAFEVVIRATVEDAAERARAIAEAVAERGLPNFYGAQRLGENARNVQKGRERLRDGRRDWLSNLHRTAWQAERFNAWLVERLAAGTFPRILRGDVAKKLDNGALFDVQDEAAESGRAGRREISATGPLFGSRMRRASGEPARVEERLLESSGVTWEELERSRLLGSRRAARVFPADFGLEPVADGLRLTFRLPKGSYATVLLAEFIGTDPDLAEDDDDA